MLVIDGQVADTIDGPGPLGHTLVACERGFAALLDAYWASQTVIVRLRDSQLALSETIRGSGYEYEPEVTTAGHCAADTLRNFERTYGRITAYPQTLDLTQANGR